ncbi:MAG: hypothetical protein ACMUIA_03985 [bacterium]
MQTIRKIRLFLSSPGDVEIERQATHRVVEQINRMLGNQSGWYLEVIDWKTHVAPDMGRPQGVINSQIGPYDIFVGIMWKRFGTPTGVAESGTKEEFDRAYVNWQYFGKPRIMFYFSQVPYTPQDSSEIDQWGKVLKFKKELQQKGLIREYRTADEFAELLREHLAGILQ